MLERTVRCLDHGGRKVWRLHKHTFRSHQTLQSTFWRHGAGDLELPLWCYAITENQLFAMTPEFQSNCRNFLVQHYYPRAARGIILDFLYPERTLELLRRISISRIRCLQRHSAGRSAGLILRKYASVARKEETPANSGLHFPAAPPAEGNVKSDTCLLDVKSSLRSVDDLRSILTSENRSQYREAWSLLASIFLTHQTPSLLAQLLQYLSTSVRLIDSKRAQILFDLLPDTHRTHKVFSSLILMQMRLGRPGQAVIYHKRAASVSAIDSETSCTLLTSCISNENWQLALEVYEDFLKGSSRCKTNLTAVQSQAWIEKEFLEPQPVEFWQEVSKIPNVVQKACSFVSIVKRYFDLSSFSESLGLRRFLYGLIYSTVAELHSTSTNIILRMLDDLSSIGLSRPWIYETYVKGLLSSGSQRKILACYGKYRESTYFQPSAPFLETILRSISTWDDHKTLMMVLSDWRKHVRISHERICYSFMIKFARLGDVKTVHDIFNEHVDRHGEQVTLFIIHPILHAHALRLEIDDLEKEFARIKNDFGLEPDLKCWNILIHAYTRAGNLHEALRCLSYLLDTDLKPNGYTLVPIMGAAASKGDVGVIQQLLEIIESRGLEKSTAMLDTLVEAHINNEEIAKAETIVRAALEMPLRGSRSRMWTQLIAAYAVRKDAKNALRLYNMMQEFGVPLNSMTYAALMRVLTALKQTGSALSILTEIMPKAKMQVQAVHYAIIIQGFANENNLPQMRYVLRLLHESRLQPTINTQRAIIMANIVEDKARQKLLKLDHPGLRFDAGDAVLEEILSVADSSVISAKQPFINSANIPFHQRFPAAYFDVIMGVYSSQRSYEMVENLLNRYLEMMKFRLPKRELQLPLVMIRIMMTSHLSRNQFSNVEKYWLLARKTMWQLFRDERKVGLLTLPTNQTYALSRHLEIYMKALSTRPKAFFKLRNIFRTYRAEGFALDHQCMNLYVRLLTATGPMCPIERSFIERPYIAIPFEVCESELMEQWPGWLTSITQTKNSFRRLSSPELEYLDIRFLKHNQCVASFKTLSRLRVLLQDLKGKAIFSLKLRSTLADLRKKAPRTIEAIDSMPKIELRSQRIGAQQPL